MEAAETVGPSANALLLETDPAARGPREQCELPKGQAQPYAHLAVALVCKHFHLVPAFPTLLADEMHYAELALIQIGQALELKRLLSEEMVGPHGLLGRAAAAGDSNHRDSGRAQVWGVQLALKSSRRALCWPRCRAPQRWSKP